ncbi:DMT family transporter [Candidatus Sumerlaeota bacterium]|nr:DMT family transporter [Candidatus Sumerlaeota bacterium]
MNDPNNDTLKIIDRVGRRNQAAAEVALIAVTFVWGTTFVIVKDAIRTVPLHWFLFLRFALAAGALWFLAWFQSRRGHLPPLDHRGLFRAGASLGFLLFMGFEMQTLGLITTTATKSAFITGTVTLWVPVLGFVILRHRPNLWVAVAVPLGILGLFLLTIAPQNLSLGIHGWVFGDTQTLFC